MQSNRMGMTVSQQPTFDVDRIMYYRGEFPYRTKLAAVFEELYRPAPTKAELEIKAFRATLKEMRKLAAKYPVRKYNFLYDVQSYLKASVLFQGTPFEPRIYDKLVDHSFTQQQSADVGIFYDERNPIQEESTGLSHPASGNHW